MDSISSRAVYPSEQQTEHRQQQVCIVEQRLPDKTQAQKGGSRVRCPRWNIEKLSKFAGRGLDRKAVVYLELSLVRDLKGDIKGFYQYILAVRGSQVIMWTCCLDGKGLWWQRT